MGPERDQDEMRAASVGQTGDRKRSVALVVIVVLCIVGCLLLPVWIRIWREATRPSPMKGSLHNLELALKAYLESHPQYRQVEPSGGETGRGAPSQ